METRHITTKQNRAFKMTSQRLVIMEELRKVTSHPTADEIYHMVRQRLPKVSLGTVYRNLEFLSNRGVITKIETPGASMRFDGNTLPHSHVRCRKCGKVEDVAVQVRVSTDQDIADVSGYTDIAYQVEIIGICSQCQEIEDSSHTTLS